MTTTSGELEDLVKGTGMDAGQITFSSMTPSSLNKQGFYTGSSTFPTTGTIERSATTGISPGTCTETGLQSIGQFILESSNQQGQQGSRAAGRGQPSDGKGPLLDYLVAASPGFRLMSHRNSLDRALGQLGASY